MAKSSVKYKASPGLISTIGIGAATGALAGVGALVVYGLVVTKSKVAMLAAEAALIAGLGGIASGLVMRRDNKRLEKALAEAETKAENQSASAATPE